jgi:hypothetical protein
MVHPRETGFRRGSASPVLVQVDQEAIDAEEERLREGFYGDEHGVRPPRDILDRRTRPAHLMPAFPLPTQARFRALRVHDPAASAVQVEAGQLLWAIEPQVTFIPRDEVTLPHIHLPAGMPTYAIGPCETVARRAPSTGLSVQPGQILRLK